LKIKNYLLKFTTLSFIDFPFITTKLSDLLGVSIDVGVGSFNSFGLLCCELSCELWEFFLEGISAPGDKESEFPPEPGPDMERLKNFLFGVEGVPSRDSLSLNY